MTHIHALIPKLGSATASCGVGKLWASFPPAKHRLWMLTFCVAATGRAEGRVERDTMILPILNNHNNSQCALVTIRYLNALRKEPEDALPVLSFNFLGISEMQTSLGGALQESLQSPVWGVVSSWKEGGERWRRRAPPKHIGGRAGSLVAR